MENKDIHEIKCDADVKIFAKTVEHEVFQQVKALGNYSAYTDSKIRIMPDCHAGRGCVIGTTMTVEDKITPNLIGVDIGCGMLTVNLGRIDIDLEKLDKIINKHIPHGFGIHNKLTLDPKHLENLRCIRRVNLSRACKSIGSLGGGNHFIELGVCSQDDKYLVIHSGSRGLGNQIAKHYQNLAHKKSDEIKSIKEDIIKNLKIQGRESEISDTLKNLKKSPVIKDLCHLEGDDMQDYLIDMRIAQDYAAKNRREIADIIINKLDIKEFDSFETIHNYLDFNSMILRKGAVSANKDEILLIPMNMRDGSLICKGKGNPDWNYSAPHGAGRLFSRSKAKKYLDLDDFEKQMEGIYSTSVGKSTLDEAPDAYKPMDEIIEMIGDTVDVIDIIKPLYNFKSH